MADLTFNNSSKTVSILASEEEKPVRPNWFAELVLLSHLWERSGLVSQLNKRVKVVRGRMGWYEVVDFVLVLLAYCVSHQETLKPFFKKTRPFQSALAALWDRDKSPSASALSRFLLDVGSESVSELRKLLFQDLLTHGIRLESIGGLLDRTSCRHILFDIDATKDAARQRSLVASSHYPPPRRRRSNYGPGYSGRKRGEVVRTRTTVQQAHTHEWLGTFGSSGNGDVWGELEQSCHQIKAYMQAHQLSPEAAIARLDGLYGWARGAQICQLNSIGYLMRCTDYGLLEEATVIEKLKLESCTAEVFEQIETAHRRQLYDIGFINWYGGKDKSINVRTRLIVAKSDAPLDGSRPRVGKLKGNKVYELLVTDRPADKLSAPDLVSLYFGRGGFEQTLGEEDQEQETDRFCSQNQAGQEFWQLLGQWVWNARLRLGFVALSPELRRTLWAEAIASKPEQEFHNQVPAEKQISQPPCEITQIEKAREADPFTSFTLREVQPSSQQIRQKALDCSNSSQPSEIEISCAKIKMAQPSKQASSKFSAEKFLLQSDGTMKCPASKTLRPTERRKEGRQTRIVYQAKAQDCRNCHLAQDCKINPAATTGRRVSILLALATAQTANALLPLPPLNENHYLEPATSISLESTFFNLSIGSEPVYWDDLPATSLRRFVPNLLGSQQIEIKMPGLPMSTNFTVLTRDHRAHRRLTWILRFKRNAAPRFSTPWGFHLYGLPAKVSAYLSNISTLAA